MDFTTLMPQTGRRYKEDGSVINSADAIQQIKTGKTAQITMDSYRAAIEDGNGYTVEFSDYTGIPAGTSYYYILKNMSETKSLWIRPLEFASRDATTDNVGAQLDALQITVVKDGLFSLDGGATTIDLNDYTTGAYDALKMPVLNLNGNYPNTSDMGLWYFTGIATAQSKVVTWEDTATDKLLKTVSSALYENKKNQNSFRIVPPGTVLMAIMTNVSGKKAGYTVSSEWAEV
ncbi:MAG: hypothetical protein PHO93_01660 [Candidatus Saccharimonadaceae bacterium]|nr:hypothetical protein [Candidatus Saccharimonadaceae bacterium]